MTPLAPLFHLLPLLALFTALPSASANHGHHNRRAHERARKAYNHQHRDAPAVADDSPAIVERTQHYDNRTLVEREHHFDNRTLVPRASYTGVGTFYYTGLGACGQYSSDSDYMVALNSAQYGSGYPGPQCFKYITIQVGSKQISNVEILDECPTCDYGSLDLSPGLFTQFAGEDAGTIHLTWWFAGDGDATSTSTSTTPTSTYTPPTSTYVAPSSTSTSEWHEPSTSSSSSEWVEPSTASSTAASSSEQWSSQPAETSTSTTPSSTESSTAASSTITSSATFSSSAALNSTANPFAVISSASPSGNATVSATVSAGATGGSTGSSVATEGSDEEIVGNLEAINALAAQYGQLVVKAAGA
ncbi:hypothetical protein IAT38_000751 [Cryptococcus sp. DSM 104549]